VAGVVTMPQEASAAQCISGQAPSSGGHNTASATFLICGPAQPGDHGANIQSSKDTNPDAKISGSQTGFGAINCYLGLR